MDSIKALPPDGPPRVQTPRQEMIVEMVLREFSQDQLVRNTTASQWDEIAMLIDPPSRNTFMFGNFNWPGEKKSQQQVDATGMMALKRFAAICDSLLTPRNLTWHNVAADSDYVMKDRDTKLYFEAVTKALFKYRYEPIANFCAQNYSTYKNLGAYGTRAMFVDTFDGALTGTRGLRYKAVPIGELFIRENHQGLIDGFIRWFRFTARQAFKAWPDTFPDQLRPALEQGSSMLFDFLHYVAPRDDFDPERLDERGKLYASYYVSMQGRKLVQEGGYFSFPMAISRYDQTPGEVYGRSPAMDVLPALKTLNAEKRVFLKQGHRAADPVLLLPDDGLMNLTLRPGSPNYGGVTADGKPLVHVLPSGDIQITKEMMAEEKQLINDAFLSTLFQILTETPQMTATEVIERTTEKGILLAPTLGRQQSEHLGPQIDREIDVLNQQGLLPPLPPRLREARGAYKVVYTSPLSRMMRSGDASGFWRTVDQAKDVANITQDPSIFDKFDFDVGIEETATINGTLPSWMADDKAVAMKRRNRAQAQAKQQQIQAAPAAAAMMKARTQQAEAGLAPQQQQPGGFVQ